MIRTDTVKKVTLSLSVAAIVIAGSAYFQTYGRVEAVNIAGSAAPALAAGVASGYDAPGLPKRIEIPAISVDAHVQETALAKDGTSLGTPTNCTDAAWYDAGPRPGAPGSAVIDGHLDCIHSPEAVFYSIGDLKAGDLIKVTDDAGTVRTFKVSAVKTYGYDQSADDVFTANDNGSHLNLITCGGNWMKDKKLYDERVVVFSDLVR